MRELQKLRAAGDKSFNKRNFAKEKRWTASALLALQFASESYLVGLLEDTNLVAMNAGRVTIMQRDMRLVRALRGETDQSNIPG